jgi:hypothetical protein
MSPKLKKSLLWWAANHTKVLLFRHVVSCLVVNLIWAKSGKSFCISEQGIDMYKFCQSDACQPEMFVSDLRCLFIYLKSVD